MNEQMKQQDGGGQAFPAYRGFDAKPPYVPGMEMRDYFAIHADQPGQIEIVCAAGLTVTDGRLVNVSERQAMTFDQWWASITQERRLSLYAKVRYAMADAMLAARKPEANR